MKKIILSAFSLFLVLLTIEVLIVHVSYTRAQETIFIDPNLPNFPIQAAINSANPGDTVIVAKGTYFENINFSGKEITVRSTDPNDPDVVAKTIIDGGENGSAVCFDGNDRTEPKLSGFTIRNGRSALGAGIYCHNTSPTIDHCTIISNESNGPGGGIYLNNSDAYIQGCNISGNTAYTYGGGIYCDANSLLTIDSCLISNNKAFSYPFFTYYLAPEGGGIYCLSFKLEITNCTLSDNSSYSSISFSGSSLSITNCILWNNTTNEIIVDSNALEITYSCIKGNEVHPGIGNINVSPIFVNQDPNNPDYHLSPNSPCIDSGDPDTNIPCGGGGTEFDLDHIGRPQDGDNNGSCIFDMGAYEFCPDPDNDGLCGTYDICPNDPNNNPNAPEICDGKDNDCDNEVDEDLGFTTCGVGECEVTVQNCVNGQMQECNPGQPSPEECDNLDNDCNGSIDDGLGTTTCGLGECEHTIDNCVNGTPQECDPMEGASPEICDGFDNDCDGSIDEDFLDTDNDGIADCIDECLNDPNNNCIDYSIQVEAGTMKMISFVHIPDNANATTVFGDEVRGNYYPERFKIGTYNSELGYYIEYGENLIVVPGKGYWCYARDRLNIVFNDVIPVSPSNNEVELLFDSNTNDGWNMIACPYNTNYLWDDVQVRGCDPNDPNAKTISELAMENDCNCIDRLLLWKWNNGTWKDGTYVYYNPNPNNTCGNDPNEYESDSDPNMRPNVGYWVNVKRENVFLIFPLLTMPRAKDSHHDVLISDTISQEGKSSSASRKATTTTVSDSPPAPLGSRTNRGGFSETGSGGCFINNMSFGLPKYTPVKKYDKF